MLLTNLGERLAKDLSAAKIDATPSLPYTRGDVTSPPRLKVVLGAYACHPAEGSEPGVGWNWLRCLARHHDIWLLTEAQRFAPAVSEAIAADPELRSSITVVGVPRSRRFERTLGQIAYYWTYRRWQRDAYSRALELHRHVRFDLAHHLNMIGYREPGYLWQLGIPFVWGPIGGFAQFPFRFLDGTRGSGTLALGTRNIANAIQMRVSRRVRAALSAAEVLIAATSVDRSALLRLYGRDALLLHETGCVATQYPEVRRLQKGEPLRVLWCGLMVPRKAVSLALRAVALASQSIPIELHLCGDGPQAALAQNLARTLRIDTRCRFHGRIAHSAMPAMMRTSHVLVFPSLQEATSATVPEALASGLPVITHATCGHGDVVTPTAGIAVPVNSPRRSVQDFAAAMVALWRDPSRLEFLSRGAAARAAELSWDEKAIVTSALYRKLAPRVVACNN